MHLAADAQQHGHALKIEDIQRVGLGLEGIRLTYSITGIPIARDFPMQMKQRGVEMRMIIGNSQPMRMDHTLIKVVAQAHRWFEEFLSGKVKSLTELAKREEMSGACISYRSD